MDTLEMIRNTVATVKQCDLSDHDADTPLDLDSIARITLIVELENLFDVQLNDAGLTPEVFESLSSIQSYIENLATVD